MASPVNWYGHGLIKAMNKEVNWLTDDIKVMLCTSEYTSDQANHKYKSDITNEITGINYTARGRAITGKTAAFDGTTKVVSFDAEDTTWPAATFTARYGIIYNDTGDDSTSPLLGWIDFVEDKIATNGNFTIIWHEDGALSIDL